ncbi:caspase family protein [Paraclostridium sordellii]|uniref:caspase family protein n=1 Tax=Paraclostridium sordellii TaxID=1505 RepID=UPI0030D1D91E
MNIAILIGVDIYDMPDGNLPGCKNDILLMKELLSSIGKFEDMLVINNNEDGKVVKDTVLKFVKKHKENGSSIEDLFFYFTGHGCIYNDEFYYLLKDCAPNKIKQTSLENSELDMWIRELSPKTTIKVIDACHSGKQYIKSVDNPNLLMEKSLKGINNCYFMSSSKSSQTSIATEAYSYFTISFLNSILNSDNGTIRYKEIMDYISDDFSSLDKQTPYFVCQADYTDIFGTVTDELKNKIELLLKKIVTEFEKLNDVKNSPSLVELIEADAKMYCTEDEMIELFDELKVKFEKYKLDNIDLNKLYDVKVEFLNELPYELNLSFIGEFIEADNKYFAETVYKSEKYTEIEMVRKKNAGIFASFSLGNFYEEKEVEKVRDIVSSFKLTQPVPYNLISISYTPKYLNLKSFCVNIFFIFSKKDIVFFTCQNTFKELNWQETSVEFDDSWDVKIICAKKKKDVEEYIKNSIDSSGKIILEDLVREFKVSNK